MADVTLSNAVRNNLLSLQNTANMLSGTQERLATGKKVNSALDNPSNFFTASSLSTRSTDLSALLDSVSNSVQSLKAADTGIKGLTKLVESAKATARQALQAPNAYTAKPSVTSTVTTVKADALTGVSNKLTGTVGGLTASSTFEDTGAFEISTGDGSGSAKGIVTVQAGVTTAQGVIDQVNAITGLSARLTDSGALEITSADGTGVKVSNTGTADELKTATNTSGTTGLTRDTILENITAANDLTPGNVTVNGTTIAITDTTTVGAFIDSLNAIDGVKAGLNKEGALVITSVGADLETADTGTTGALGANGLNFASLADVTATETGDDTLANAGMKASTPNALSGESITVTTGDGTNDERSVTVKFGTGPGQVNSLEALNKAFGDAGVAVEGVVTSEGKLKIQSTNAAAGQTFEIAGTAQDDIFGAATATTSLDSTPATFGGAGDDARKGFAKDYNDLLKQMSGLISDASYNGINLLAGDDLSVVFNENGSSKLDIKGVNFTAEGLGLNDITDSDFRDSDSVNDVITKLDTALGSLRSQASKFGSNLSIVETRQNFTKELINVLETGAANLTLADTNEEGANALALQTRQQLSTTALSLSSQADQAVLRLF